MFLQNVSKRINKEMQNGADLNILVDYCQNSYFYLKFYKHKKSVMYKKLTEKEIINLCKINKNLKNIFKYHFTSYTQINKINIATMCELFAIDKNEAKKIFFLQDLAAHNAIARIKKEAKKDDANLILDFF